MEFSQEWITEFMHTSKSFVVDFVAGSVAGVAVTLSGHPFE